MKEPVYLRALYASDIERTLKWHNDPTIYDTLIGSFHYVSRTTESAWIMEKTKFSTTETNLAICIADTENHIGNIYLREIDWVYRHAEIGILIGEEIQRSKGYGQSAMKQMMKYAFDELGLKRIYLHVQAMNQRAVHVYEKIGYKTEGVLRSQIFKNGEWRDVIVMGILREEFVPSKN